MARAAHDRGYRLIVVTNQSGIGRGYYTEQQFNQLTEWMCNEFLSEVSLTNLFANLVGIGFVLLVAWKAYHEFWKR